MPVLEPPTDDLTRRVTSDELSPDGIDLDTDINPLVDQPLFIGEDRAPGIQPNPANGSIPEQPEKSFREEYRDRKQAKKNGTEPQAKELPKTKNQHAITPQDQQVIHEIEQLVKNKKYGAALAMIAGNPRVREIMRSKVSEIRNQMALDAAKARVKMLIKNAIRSAVMDILVATSPWWEIILVVVLCIIALVIGIAIMMSRPVDNPPSDVPLGITNGNETGIYLSSSIMTPVMKVTDNSGKTNARTKELHLEATAGGWGKEDPAVKCGSTWCLTTTGETLSLGEWLPSTTTETDMENYITMRFPYIHGTDFDYRNNKNGPPRQGWAEKKDYSGRKIIVFNPKNNTAVVALAAEWGPAPWTGVCADRDSNTNNAYNKRIVAPCTEQRAAWNSRDVVAGPKTRVLPLDMRAYDITPPANFTGRIAGGEAILTNKLGASNDQVLIYGYATDQSLKPGTVLNIKPSDIVQVNGTSSVQGGTATDRIIAAAREYLSSKTFPSQGYSPCAKFVTSVLNEAGVMEDYERACVMLNSLLSGASSQGILTKQFPSSGSVEKFDISKADDAGTNENNLLNALVPGDVIIVTTDPAFPQKGNHTVIYAGKEGGKHSIIHTTGVTRGVFKKNAGVAHTTIESISPIENGPYDFWSAYSFRSWNGKKVGGSFNN